jgi:serine/threonine protein kinase
MAAEPPAGSRSGSLVGLVVREYEILELLGSGGFGRVYRAVHRLLGIDRALKVLHDHIAADPAVRRLFLEEARAAEALRHDHVVRVTEVFEHDGRLWIVMDLVEGSTLRERLAENGRLPVGETLAVAEALAAALDHAHGRGVVHCDLKPGNVLLRRSDGAALLSDFGLARLQSERTRALQRWPGR